MKNLTENNHNLQISLTPGTVYITSKTDQKSLTNLIFTIVNKGEVAVAIKSISITVPEVLASKANWMNIEPVCDKSELLLFKSDKLDNQFDAKPVGGDSALITRDEKWTFNLNKVALVNIIAKAIVEVPVKITFKDDSVAYTAMPAIQLKPAIASIDNFMVEKAVLGPGEKAKLIWDCHSISYVIINPKIGKKSEVSGEALVDVDDDTTFTMYAYGAGIILFAQLRVTVNNVKIISFTSNAKGQLAAGAEVNLQWKCSEATQTVILANTGGLLPRESTFTGNDARTKGVSFRPITQPTKFTLSAQKEDQQYIQKEITVNITDVTVEFSGTPITGLWQRDKVTLTWDIVSATEITLIPALTGGPSLQKLKGNIEIRPESDVIYVLRVKGFNDNKPVVIEKKIDLKVEQVIIHRFEMTDEFRNPSSVRVLDWNVKAQVRTIDNGKGSVDAVGTWYPPKNWGTRYMLSAGTIQNPAILTRTVVY